jgi:hypothetical protein
MRNRRFSNNGRLGRHPTPPASGTLANFPRNLMGQDGRFSACWGSNGCIVGTTAAIGTGTGMSLTCPAKSALYRIVH